MDQDRDDLAMADPGSIPSFRIESGTDITHSTLLKIAYHVNNKYIKHDIGVVVAKLKLRNEVLAAHKTKEL